MTGGRGVDNVVEVAGGDSMKQSLRAVRVGGTISVVGVLAGAVHDLVLPRIIVRHVHLAPITVGSREGLEAMILAVGESRLKPVVDRVFRLAEIRDAIAYLASPNRFGKVCLTI